MGQHDPSRESLDFHSVEGVSAGRRDALATLYERYAQDVYAVSLRLTGSRPDAWDVTHDVFVGLPEALRTSYEERGRFRSWLLKLTTRTALQKLRRRRSHREVRFSLPRAPPRAGAEDRSLDRIALQRAVETLEPGWRAVLLLRGQGFSHAEIGDTLGISTGASRTRLYRARRELKRRLGEGRR